jgi:hypothetical protein
MLAQIAPGETRRIGRADDRADRAAGDPRWPGAEFVERFQHQDMAQAASAAGAEHERQFGRGRTSRGGLARTGHV